MTSAQTQRILELVDACEASAICMFSASPYGSEDIRTKAREGHKLARTTLTEAMQAENEQMRDQNTELDKKLGELEVDLIKHRELLVRQLLKFDDMNAQIDALKPDAERSLRVIHGVKPLTQL